MKNKLLKIAEAALIRILEVLTIGIRAITKWIQANPKTARYAILFLIALSILAPILLILTIVR